MKSLILIVIAFSLVACSGGSSSSSDPVTSQGVSVTGSDESYKLQGKWSYASSRVDQRLGQIYNRTYFYFLPNNELVILQYVEYAMAPAANAKRINKGTYSFINGKLSISTTESTCGALYSAPMDLFSGLGTGDLEFRWAAPDSGYYSLYLYFNSASAVPTDDAVPVDYGCSRFH